MNGKRVLEMVLSEWVLEYWGLDENFCHQEKIEVKIKGTEAEIDTE